jgi:hypothetical protein
MHPDSTDGGGGELGGLGGLGELDGGVRGGEEGELEARSTCIHCGGHTTGWMSSASLLAALGFVMCGLKAAEKAAATPTRTSARKLEASVFACRLRWGSSVGACCRARILVIQRLTTAGGNWGSGAAALAF